jgi:hypothetical protein
MKPWKLLANRIGNSDSATKWCLDIIGGVCISCSVCSGYEVKFDDMSEAQDMLIVDDNGPACA